MKVDIPSFSENLDIKSFMVWICEVDKFFDMTYIPIEKQVKFVHANSMEEQPHDGINYKSHEDVKKKKPVIT